MASRGPIQMKAWNRQASPTTNPTMPEIPRRSQRHPPTERGSGVRSRPCARTSQTTAMTRRTRLTAIEPSRRLANVNTVEERANMTEVPTAASAPRGAFTLARRRTEPTTATDTEHAELSLLETSCILESLCKLVAERWR